jgi:hypothetical protein
VHSFCKPEARSIGAIYADTFYNRSLYTDAPITSDVFFVGLDKGRGKLLEAIDNQLRKRNLIPDLHLVDNVKCRFNSKYSPRMPYNEVRQHIASTRAILDLTQENQFGLTQRVVEALFFRRKLITNNCCIREYAFYDANNIFIWEKDDLNRLTDFIHSPYIEPSHFDINKFDVQQWLNRVQNNLPFDE